ATHRTRAPPPRVAVAMDPGTHRTRAPPPRAAVAMDPGTHRTLNARPPRWIWSFIRESGCEYGNPSRPRLTRRDGSGNPSHLRQTARARGTPRRDDPGARTAPIRTAGDLKC